MYAISEKNLKNVRLLLECGADVKKANNNGKGFRVLLAKYDFEKKISLIYFIFLSECGIHLSLPRQLTDHTSKRSTWNAESRFWTSGVFGC